MKKAYISIGLTVVIFVILLLHIDYLRFVCDDAFISFRYAKNFVEGHGLVYNIGERVEGYTNFLWTLLVSLFMKMGLDVVVVSQVLGALFSLGTVLLLLRLNRWLYPRESLFNYLAPLLLACCGAYAAWSTGGLETSLYTFLILLGSLFFLSGMTEPKRLAFSGITFSLICMTRLDGLLFAGTTFLCLLHVSAVSKKIRPRNVLIWTISFLVPFLVYFFWRWSYYGRLLPNTFYVKMGGEMLYRHGLSYLFDFVKRFWIWILVIPLIFLSKAIRRNEHLRIIIPYFTSIILVLSFYIIYIGGDFMDMFRFLVPILPFFFFLVQEGFRGMHDYLQILSKKKHKIAAITAEILLITLSLFLLAIPSKESNKRWSRNDIDSIGALRESAKLWTKVGLMFRSANPSESISTSAAGAIPYYSGLYTIDELGLTLMSQSDLEVQKALRPGHWKKVSDKYLLSQKPTYILGHPQISNQYIVDRAVPAPVRYDLFLENGYEAMIFTVNMSENEAKYLYCLRKIKR
jgi:arabinofuranosyltransferase